MCHQKLAEILSGSTYLKIKKEFPSNNDWFTNLPVLLQYLVLGDLFLDLGEGCTTETTESKRQNLVLGSSLM